MFSRFCKRWQARWDRRRGQDQSQEWERDREREQQQEQQRQRIRRECLERDLNSDRLPLVRYLPAMKTTTFLNQTPSSEWLARWVPSHLRSICAEPHNASCHICLLDFEEPQLRSVGDQAQAKVEPLRRLACRHVFHALCIDTYIQSDESNRWLCPVCQEKIITMTSYLERWRLEFDQLMSAKSKELGHYDAIPEGGLRENYAGEPLEFDKKGLPIVRKYTFAPNNKYLGSSYSKRSYLNDAKKLLENNGNLSEATLLIEAAIQEGDLGEGKYEAWILLGETRTLDMQYKAGLQALTEGVRRASAKGSPAGMLFLASQYLIWTSCKACCTVLVRWLQMRFSPSLLNDPMIHNWRSSYRNSLDRIIDTFLSIVRAQHRKSAVDPEIQLALGIIFSIKKDYLSEIVCYANALAAQPRDYILWNSLALSLGRYDMPEESLDAFTEALQLRPSYTEAIVSLGVLSYDNGAYKEAAEQFLSGLAVQEFSGGKGSEGVWVELRNALMEMNREDLANISNLEAGTSLDVFRTEGFRFLDATTHSIR